jgi:hypothetical protein
MWTAAVETVSGGRVRRIVLRRGDDALPYAEAIELWQRDRAFGAFFMALLAEQPFAAYFWECPPLTEATLTRPTEFVLVDSPQLASMPPDARAFTDRFESAETGEGIATFWNLGRDALLVAPRRCPDTPISAYAHLAAYARRAPAGQRQALWRAVGAAVARQMSTRPLWLSTSGLGVAWLHVRLDRRPKYYSYQPYRDIGL